MVKLNWNTVTEFENKIAEYFGSPYAVAVDSCTQGIELVLRYKNFKYLKCPQNTYLSIPMLANKLNIPLVWDDCKWQKIYWLSCGVADAATLWERNSFSHGFMCLSFQYQKHLSLGRGGMILCPDKESYDKLKKMSYDGRVPGIPWRDQDIDTMGYHYYMTPETAQLGLDKLQTAIDTDPRLWSYKDYPDLSQMKIFKGTQYFKPYK